VKDDIAWQLLANCPILRQAGGHAPVLLFGQAGRAATVAKLLAVILADGVPLLIAEMPVPNRSCGGTPACRALVASLPLVRILTLVRVLPPAGVRFLSLRLFGLPALLTILISAGRCGLVREYLTGCQYPHDDKGQGVLRFHVDFLSTRVARDWHAAKC
jgi:hypothetical protein